MTWWSSRLVLSVAAVLSACHSQLSGHPSDPTPHAEATASSVGDDDAEASDESSSQAEVDWSADQRTRFFPPSVSPMDPRPSASGLGPTSDIIPARVRISVLTVYPDDFRSLIKSDLYDRDRAELLACARQHHDDDDTLSGSVVVELTIGNRGRVTTATVESRDIAATQTYDCMLDVVEGWRFDTNVQAARVSVQIEVLPRRHR